MAVSLPLRGDSINQKLLSGESSIWSRMTGRSPAAGYDDVQREMERTAPDAIAQSIQSVSHLDVLSKLRQLRAPLLVVHGEQDNVVTPEDVTGYTGMNSSMRTMVIPQCRHFPMLDRGSQFNRLLLDFLRAPEDLNGLELKAEWQRRIR
jgi:pimeloyl-ACP methyl ester carboxylesterase